MSDKNNSKLKLSYFDESGTEKQLGISLSQDGELHFITLDNPKKMKEVLHALMFLANQTAPMTVKSADGSPAPVNISFETNELYIQNDDFISL